MTVTLTNAILAGVQHRYIDNLGRMDRAYEVASRYSADPGTAPEVVLSAATAYASYRALVRAGITAAIASGEGRTNTATLTFDQWGATVRYLRTIRKGI